MKRYYAVATILIALFTLTLSSCASNNKTCDAYQCVELGVE